MRFLDEVVQHLLCGVEIGNHAVAHRLDGRDATRRSTDHGLCFAADGFNFGVHGVQGDDGRLAQDDALTARKDACVGCPKIDGEVVGEHGERTEQHAEPPGCVSVNRTDACGGGNCRAREGDGFLARSIMRLHSTAATTRIRGRPNWTGEYQGRKTGEEVGTCLAHLCPGEETSWISTIAKTSTLRIPLVSRISRFRPTTAYGQATTRLPSGGAG